MSRRQQDYGGWGCVIVLLFIIGLGLLTVKGNSGASFGGIVMIALGLLIAFFPALSSWQEKRAQAERARRAEAERNLQDERKRQRVESLLRRDAVGDEINYISGREFEQFMAGVFRQKGYDVQETPTNDQGVDLLLDIDGKRVAVQLKRWTAPVGNGVVGATFAGMAHYDADEGWIITTSTFTRSAKELARSTRVRLIDGKELDEWLKGLGEE